MRMPGPWHTRYSCLGCLSDRWVPPGRGADPCADPLLGAPSLAGIRLAQAMLTGCVPVIIQVCSLLCCAALCRRTCGLLCCWLRARHHPAVLCCAVLCWRWCVRVRCSCHAVLCYADRLHAFRCAGRWCACPSMANQHHLVITHCLPSCLPFRPTGVAGPRPTPPPPPPPPIIPPAPLPAMDVNRSMCSTPTKTSCPTSPSACG